MRQADAGSGLADALSRLIGPLSIYPTHDDSRA